MEQAVSEVRQAPYRGDRDRAAALGDVEACRMLLDAGADPNAQQQGGYVPRGVAVLNGKDELAELLRARGARVSGNQLP